MIPSDDRTERLARVLEEAARAMEAGRQIDDAALIARHPDLMPELAERLKLVRRIQERLNPDADRTVCAVDVTDAPALPRGHDKPPSDSLPGYELMDEIHRGGQGVVYKAIQKSTNRKVAIKVMKEGPFAGLGDRSRFEREVQILGQLKHPNIVTIHDTGHAAGCHYFVMDYILGAPLDDYLRDKKPTIEQTLAIFAKICDAVNAAHLRGIIHRDLKPGNIRIDSNGEPHVLDFGLAKLVGSELGKPAMTMTGQFIGSLPWASPEQAQGNPALIDVRTDVYSLGVILYQMLTGRFPYEVLGNMRDVLDRILNAEPARPSTIRRQINDEVETIVLKCLQKDRNRRYQSAGELSRDIGHFLRGEAIEAKRDSVLYVLRKHMQRHRGAFVVAGAMLVMLAASSVLFAWQATRERQAKLEAIAARNEARAASQIAVREADRAQAISAYLHALLSAPRLAENPSDVRVVEFLAEAATELEHRFAGKPELAAAAHQLVGDGYRAIGDLASAESHIHAALGERRRVLGAHHPDTIGSSFSLAQLRLQQERPEEAERLARETLEAAIALHGPDGEEALDCMATLAFCLQKLRRLDEARDMALRTVQRRRTLGSLGSRSGTLALNNLFSVLIVRRELDVAQQMIPEIETAIASLEPKDPLRIDILLNLAGLLWRRGQLADAEQQQRRIVAFCEQHYSEASARTAGALADLGRTLLDRARFDQADDALTRAIAIFARPAIDDPLSAAVAECDRVAVWIEQGRMSEARLALPGIVERCVSQFGQSSLVALRARFVQAELLLRSAQFADAYVIARSVLEVRQSGGGLGPDHPDTLRSLAQVGRTLVALGRAAEAEPLLREAVERGERALTAGHFLKDALHSELANCLAVLAKSPEGGKTTPSPSQ